MAIDLLVTNATLTDGTTGVDIACSGGRIIAVERGITAEARRTLDAAGSERLRLITHDQRVASYTSTFIHF